MSADDRDAVMARHTGEKEILSVGQTQMTEYGVLWGAEVRVTLVPGVDLAEAVYVLSRAYEEMCAELYKRAEVQAWKDSQSS